MTSHQRAETKWRKQHRNLARRSTYRSATRHFISHSRSVKELFNIIGLARQRIASLREHGRQI